jgi:ATP/maltotriose-dependent transcriptional regulator MalT
LTAELALCWVHEHRHYKKLTPRFVQLDQRKGLTLAKKDHLLLVLSHPEILLHNHPAELGARQRVRKRDVSLQARTSEGIGAWDTFQTEETLCLIEQVRSRAKADGQMSQMEALVLQALVQQALGHLLQALSALQEALTLAEPEGYVRLFVDEGAPMAELLQQVLAAGGASPYVMTLLESQGVAPSQEQGPSLPRVDSHAGLMEPLSEREVEVLGLLATGRSNAELAQTLVISMSTVRTHLRHIYDKLGVTNRTQAVARARELHLLAS